MKYIYMNHRIRQKRPRNPVIVCQEDGRTVESNCFELWAQGMLIGWVFYNRGGLRECETHDVKAWVELTEDVDVRAMK